MLLRILTIPDQQYPTTQLSNVSRVLSPSHSSCVGVYNTRLIPIVPNPPLPIHLFARRETHFKVSLPADASATPYVINCNPGLVTLAQGLASVMIIPRTVY